MSTLREELLAIRETVGKLTPQIVVEAARPPESPLHNRFEWDDGIAAEAFRRSQAAGLIRSVRVHYIPADDSLAPGTVRAFHAVKRPDVGHVYDPVEEVVDDPIQRSILLRDMERDWKALRKRWESFSEFWDTVRADVEKTA